MRPCKKRGGEGAESSRGTEKDDTFCSERIERRKDFSAQNYDGEKRREGEKKQGSIKKKEQERGRAEWQFYKKKGREGGISWQHLLPKRMGKGITLLNVKRRGGGRLLSARQGKEL